MGGDCFLIKVKVSDFWELSKQRVSRPEAVAHAVKAGDAEMFQDAATGRDNDASAVS